MSTVQEMREDRANLIKNLQNLCNEFQDKHSVEITDISFQRSYHIGKTYAQMLITNVEVKL